MNRSLRLITTLLLALFCFQALALPITVAAQGPDPRASAILRGLQSFADKAGEVGQIAELHRPIPLTGISAWEALSLRELLGTLFRPSATSFNSLEELAEALEQRDYSRLDGTIVSVEQVSIAPEPGNPARIAVRLLVTAQRQLASPLLLDAGALDTRRGLLPLTVRFEAPLTFTLDTGIADEARAFATQGTPILTLRSRSAGPIAPFDGQFGFTELAVSGEVAVNADLNLVLRDPDRDGRLSAHEWTAMHPSDLIALDALVDERSAVQARLALETPSPIPGGPELIPGTPDGVIALADTQLADGLVTPDLSGLSGLAPLANISPSEMLVGLANLAAGLQAAQQSVDLPLPLLNTTALSDSQLLVPLHTLVRTYGDAAVLCGSVDGVDGRPPSGSLDQLRAGERLYCRAIALQQPQTVVWSVPDATPVTRTTGLEALGTVGPEPGVSAEFVLSKDGRPDITLSFDTGTMEKPELHSVKPLFRSAQELYRLLSGAGILAPGVNAMRFDPTLPALLFQLSLRSSAAPITVELAGGDELREASHLRNLTKTEEASAALSHLNGALDVTFGTLLVNDVQQIKPAAQPADRFFIQGGPGPELRTDLAVQTNLQLTGQIGTLAVRVTGDSAVGSDGALRFAPIDPTRPMLQVDLLPTPGGVFASGQPAIPDGLRITDLLTNLRERVVATQNIGASATLQVAADPPIQGVRPGSLAITWPDITQAAPRADAGGAYTSDLVPFDVAPGDYTALTSGLLTGLDDLHAALVEAAAARAPELLPVIDQQAAVLLDKTLGLRGAVDEFQRQPPASLQELAVRLDSMLNSTNTEAQLAATGEGEGVRFELEQGEGEQGPRLVLHLNYTREVMQELALNLPVTDALHLQSDATVTFAAGGRMRLVLPLDLLAEGTNAPTAKLYNDAKAQLSVSFENDKFGAEGNVGPMRVSLGPGRLAFGARVALAATPADPPQPQPIHEVLPLLQVSRDGPTQPLSCGATFTGAALNGDLCARLAFGVGVGEAASYKGDFVLFSDDLFALPDDLDTPEGWYLEAPALNFDGIVNDLSRPMDWGLLIDGLEALPQALDRLDLGDDLPLVGDTTQIITAVKKPLEKELIQPLGELEEALTQPTANLSIADVERIVRQHISELLSATSAPTAEQLTQTAATAGEPQITLRCGADYQPCAKLTAPGTATQISDLHVSFLWQRNFTPTLGLNTRFDGALLSSSGGLQSTIDISLPVRFGLNRKVGPYIGGPDYLSEATPPSASIVQLNATLGVAEVSPEHRAEVCGPELVQSSGAMVPDDLRGYSDKHCVRAILGVLGVSLRDGITTDEEGGIDPTTASLGAELILPGYEMPIALSEVPAKLVDIQVVGTDPQANVDLRFQVGVISSGEALPSIVGTLHWSTRPEEANLDRIGELYVDVGAVVGGVIDKVREVTGPVRPVIDTLYAPLPGISDLSRALNGPDVTLLGIAELSSGQTDVELAKRLVGLANAVNDVDACVRRLVPIPFDCTVSKPQNSFIAVESADKLTDSNSLLDDLEAIGLTFPLLTSRDEDFLKVLGGQDLELAHFDAGRLEVLGTVSQSFQAFAGPIPIVVAFSGSVGVRGHLALGYSTRGLRTGDLADGLYIDDLYQGRDVPEAALVGRVSVSAGIGLVIASAGVEGGLELTAGLDIRDPNGDGKLYLDELDVTARKNPFCLFNAQGRLGAFLGVYAKVGWGPFSVSYRHTIVDVTLLDFNRDLCKGAGVTLAVLEGNDLRLNIGTEERRKARGISPNETNEVLTVRQLTAEGQADKNGTLVSVSGFGVHAEYFVPPGGRIVADACDGDDQIVLEPGLSADGKVISFTLASYLHGGSGDDKLIGAGGVDLLYGDDGNDRLGGRQNNDTLDGGANDDALEGAAGNDTLIGGGGNDLLNGGDGADTLLGGDNDDRLEGDLELSAAVIEGELKPLGAGDDKLGGGAGNDQLFGYGGNDLLCGDADTMQDASCGLAVAFPGIDLLRGGDGDDTLYGGPGNDTLEGAAGADHLFGEGDNDSLYGGEGPREPGVPPGSGDLNDTLDGGPNDDRLFGNDGNDHLFGRDGQDELFGEAGNDNLSGGLQSDELRGGTGEDRLFGDDGWIGLDPLAADANPGDNDILFGGLGDDVIFGEGGSDELDGEQGKDTLYGNSGDDIIRGGQDADRVSGGPNDDRIYGDSGDDLLYGNDHNDTLFGNEGEDYIEGNSGADSLFGGAGNDDLSGGSAIRGANDGNGQPAGEQQPRGDHLFGEAGADVLAGDNALITRPGGLTTYDNTPIRVVQLLDLERRDPEVAGADKLDGGSDNDRLFGQADNDTLRGGDHDDYAEGNAGADFIFGDAGQDDLVGGSDQAGLPDGPDQISGGNGQADLAGDFDVIAGDNAVIARPLAFGAWQLNRYNVSVQRVITLLDEVLVGDPSDASVGDADTLRGEGDDDLIYGQTAADTLNGGTGDDYIEGNSGADFIFGDSGQDDLIGGSAAPGRIDAGDTISGDSGRDDLPGDHDVIVGDNAVISRPTVCGLWQANSFNGSLVRRITLFEIAVVQRTVVVRGNDTIRGDSGDDLIYAQGGNDQVNGDSGDDYIEGNADHDRIDGGPGNDDLVGGTGRINSDGPEGVLGRIDGRDQISGGAGYDVIAGDNAMVTRTVLNGKLARCPANSVVGQRVLEGGTWVKNSFNGGVQHEPTRLLDTDSIDSAVVNGNDTLSGGEADDILYGQGGNDTLLGETGDDYSEGNAGSDTLSGGDGRDDLIGGSAAERLADELGDQIRGDAGEDVIVGDNGRIVRPVDANGRWKSDKTFGTRRDIRLFDVEIRGSSRSPRFSGTDELMGGTEADRLFGQGGEDRIFGDAGTDYIEGNMGSDSIVGGSEKDRLIGGSSSGDGRIGSDAPANNVIDGTNTIEGGGDGDSITKGNVLKP